MIFRVTKLITRRPCKAGFFLLFYILYLLLGICRIFIVVVIVVKLYLVNFVHSIIYFVFLTFHLISSHLISSHLISSHLISSHLISSQLNLNPNLNLFLKIYGPFWARDPSFFFRKSRPCRLLAATRYLLTIALFVA